MSRSQTEVLFLRPHFAIKYLRENGFTATVAPTHRLWPLQLLLVARELANRGKPSVIVAITKEDKLIAQVMKLFFGVHAIAWESLDVPYPPLRFQGPEIDLHEKLGIPREKKLVAWLSPEPVEIPGTALLPSSLPEWERLDNADLAVCENERDLYQAIAAGLPVIVPARLAKTVELHGLGVVALHPTPEELAGAVALLDLSPEARRRALDLHARAFNFEAHLAKVVARLEKFREL